MKKWIKSLFSKNNNEPMDAEVDELYEKHGKYHDCTESHFKADARRILQEFYTENPRLLKATNQREELRK